MPEPFPLAPSLWAATAPAAPATPPLETSARADVCVISDGGVLALNRPSMTYSVRGMVYMELEVKGPAHDLHDAL